MSIKTYLVTLLSFVLLTSCASIEPTPPLEISPIKYTKPDSADTKVSGELFHYMLWYDSEIWKIVDKNSPQYLALEESIEGNVKVNFFLTDKQEEVGAVIMNESRISTSYNTASKNLKKFFQKNANLLENEYRIVNGNRILFIKFNNDDIVGALYYLRKEKGSVVVFVGTTPYIFKEKEDSIYQLLNGLEYNDESAVEISNIDDSDIEEKLTQLKKLYDKGLIDKTDYEAKKSELLDDF